MYWLMNKKPKLFVENKLTTFKAILQPVRTYGVMRMQQPNQHKNIPNLSIKTHRSITGAPWFVSNLTLHNDLTIPFVNKEITFHANK
jgi:hypothetical protein